MTSNDRATTMAIIMTWTARRLAAAGRAALAVAAAAFALAATGCSLDSILKNDELPKNVTDPAITETREGAISAYHGLLQRFRLSYAGDYGNAQTSYVPFSGRLSDELQQGASNLGSDKLDSLDARSMIEGVPSVTILNGFGDLQRVRGQASQAIGLLTRYAPDEVAITGHAYALKAYAEIFLAEAFCSGIPLSTIDYDGDFTPAPGSSTDEVYAHALALLDTALTMVGDSVDFVHLARMAQARAQLGLGDVAAAAAAVADVPDDWRYEVTFAAGVDETVRSFTNITSSFIDWGVTVADREGVNGLPYRSSGDPRTRSTRLRTNQYGEEIHHPVKYLGPVAPGALRADTLAALKYSAPIVLASGLEARLIEAEADLAAGGSAWLETLNALRTDGSFTVSADPANPAVEDTTWHAGSGGTAGLAPLEDPGDADARVDLLFRERAYWLFLTGHRQADMRRLVRHYGRTDVEVYPVGEYPSTVGYSYGNDVNAPIPLEESAANPNFNGCISRDA
jgi:hypothetical protein